MNIGFSLLLSFGNEAKVTTYERPRREYSKIRKSRSEQLEEICTILKISNLCSQIEIYRIKVSKLSLDKIAM